MWREWEALPDSSGRDWDDPSMVILLPPHTGCPVSHRHALKRSHSVCGMQLSLAARLSLLSALCSKIPSGEKRFQVTSTCSYQGLRLDHPRSTPSGPLLPGCLARIAPACCGTSDAHNQAPGDLTCGPVSGSSRF